VIQQLFGQGEKQMTSPLKNIGKVTQERLNSIGVYTLEDLRETGVLETYRLLKAAYKERVTLNALWSLEAALLGIDWRAIPEQRKAELLAELENA
jgi:DNA transformation protein and related proteins